MTTFLQALPRESDKRWDYTSSTGSSSAHPIGYCAGWKEPPTGEEAKRLEAQFGPGFVERLSKEIEAKRQFKGSYHTDGHATPAEAEACYRNYELDQELEFKTLPLKEADTLHRCMAPDCGEFTAGVAILGKYTRFHLCDKHRNRSTIEKMFVKDEDEP